MRIVICVDGISGSDLVREFADLTPAKGALVTLLYVDDESERSRVEDALRPGIVRPATREFEEALDRDEREMLTGLYEEARALLTPAGASEVVLNVGTGKPERVIVSFLHDSGASLCVVGRRPDWRTAAETGPRSMGHVARYVVDHAPCPVLVIR